MHHEPTSLFRKSFVGVVILFSLLLSCADAVVYVRTWGSDTGLGTEASPYSSIAQAIASVTPTNNEINIGKGLFYCPYPNFVNTSIIFTGNTTRSTTIQQGGTGACFRFQYAGTVSSFNTLTMDMPFGLSGAEVQNSAQLTFANVEFIASSYSPLVIVRGGSKLTLVNCVFVGLRNAQSIIGTELNAIVNISNSKFSDNKMWVVRGPGITVSITGSFFGKQLGIFDVSGTVPASVYFSGNEIFNSTGTYSSQETGTIQTTFACSPTTFTPMPSSGNRYCGVSTNKFHNCGPTGVNVLGSYTFVQFHDGCGRCGQSANADKDCNGVCFGAGAICRNYTTHIVSTSGSGTECSIVNPCSFTRATQVVGYKDTISLLPGEYPMPRTNIFNGMAFTIKSYWNDPGTVNITSVTNPQLSGALINQGESFDSIFLYITMGKAIPTMTVTGQSGVTFLNCIIREGQPGGYITGGVILSDDGFMHFNNSQFIFTNSVTSIVSMNAGVLYASASEGHTTYFAATNSRFTNNYGGLGTVVANTNSQFEFRSCYFGTNAMTNNAEINIMSSSSWFFLSGCNFYNPPNQTLICAPAGSTYNPAISMTSSGYSCGTTGPTTNGNGYPMIGRVNCPRSAIAGEFYSGCGGCKFWGPSDALGNCWGYAFKDPNGTSCPNTQKDCFGMCYGGAVFDCFGTCGGNGYLSAGVCVRPPTTPSTSSSSSSSSSTSSTTSTSSSSTTSSSTSSTTSSTSSSTVTSSSAVSSSDFSASSSSSSS